MVVVLVVLGTDVAGALDVVVDVVVLDDVVGALVFLIIRYLMVISKLWRHCGI